MAKSQGPGLRELKKQRTRELIADVARRLFIERGFDNVTVAEIARTAEVSQATVFNYFPIKEDLVYWRLESFEGELIAAVRDRAPGESFHAAFRGFVLERRGLLATTDPDAIAFFVGLTRMITQSAALLERERQVFDRFTASLAALIAKETGARAGDPVPWVVANALMGVHRALVDYTRERLLAGARPPALTRDVRAQGKRALGALVKGLGDYGIKPAAGSLRNEGSVTSGR
jgi:AcrR family transcriptional regulator